MKKLKNMAIIGAQWGDEGKGKVTDFFSEAFDYVVRYQGGNNAGHTIHLGSQKVVLHLIPSGILHPNVKALISHGVVFDPESFLKEKAALEENFPVGPKNLMISPHCPVITKYHRLLDKAREQYASGKTLIGTTGKGIGPTYEDKAARVGPKLTHLLDKDALKERLELLLREKSILFEHLYKVDFPSVDEECERLYKLGQELKPLIGDVYQAIEHAHLAQKSILYEGAQGVLLDVDYGSFPYVTSSHCSIGGIYTGANLPVRFLDETMGVAKAYLTRVGEGPFPTELSGKIGEHLQTKGHEFGATTGRKRRCGWTDLPLLKYAAKVSHFTCLALTKVDVLAGLDEINVCVAYEYKGEKISELYPGIDLAEAKPIYKTLPGFKDENDTFGSESTLSPELKNFIDLIEKEVGVPVKALAYGPSREQLLVREF